MPNYIPDDFKQDQLLTNVETSTPVTARFSLTNKQKQVINNIVFIFIDYNNYNYNDFFIIIEIIL
jgi:hypothetical protein